MTIQIKDLTDCRVIDMSAVLGGLDVCISEMATGGRWCMSLDEYLQEAANNGPYALIATAGALHT